MTIPPKTQGFLRTLWFIRNPISVLGRFANVIFISVLRLFFPLEGGTCRDPHLERFCVARGAASSTPYWHVFFSASGHLMHDAFTHAVETKLNVEIVVKQLWCTLRVLSIFLPWNSSFCFPTTTPSHLCSW